MSFRCMTQNVLTIRREKKEEERKNEGKWRLWERAYGWFERSLTLPRGGVTAGCLG